MPTSTARPRQGGDECAGQTTPVMGAARAAAPSRRADGHLMTLSVLVAGPTLLREGLRVLLAEEEDFAVGTEAGPDFSDCPPPDVIICGTDAPDEVRRLRTRWPRAGVLIVGDFPPAAIHRLNALGVMGFFPLTAELDELIWAVRSVAEGNLVLHPTVLRAIVEHLAQSGVSADAPPSSPPIQLTERERDVLRCLTLGASDKEIAQQLYLSVRTVQSHLARLYHKLGVHSRTEAVLVAVRAGWVANEFGNSTEADPRHLALAAAQPR